MTGKDLLNKMELIDPVYIEAADKKPKKKPIKWGQWTSLAACLTIALISGVLILLSPDSGPVVQSSEDTASLFSTGGATMILFAASLLAALGIAAIIIKDKRK